MPILILHFILQKIVEGLDMVKDDVDKENLVVQYTDNSKEVSVNLMIVYYYILFMYVNYTYNYPIIIIT